MGKLLLLAVMAAVIWFWWRGKRARAVDARAREALPVVTVPERDAARLLGVRDDADADDVRAAWRRKVNALRPQSGDDAESLQSLTEARDLLLARATVRPPR